MIGIFDSGIGGVTVLKEIIKILPNQKYIYYSDSIHNPYGDMEENQLYIIVKDIVEYLISRGCKIVVIACNTASANCVARLRTNYVNTIFIAIEPAYKMVYDYNANEKTLIMATKATIESEKFLTLFHKYDNHKTILKPCIGLAELIENNKQEEIKQYLKEELSQYKGVKNVVLGCTHYSLIKEEIKGVLGDIYFYDGSPSVAKELKKQLEKRRLLKEESFSLEFVDSLNDEKKKKRFYSILEN